MPRGIRDKVAIIGMGCTRFGERWDADTEQLIVEAYQEAIADAGIETSQIDAAWLCGRGRFHPLRTLGHSPERGAAPPIMSA